MAERWLTLERVLVALTLAILVWAPLPAASNRPWSSALLVLLVALLAVGWSYALLQARRPHRLMPPAGAWWMFALLLAAQAWVLVQITSGISTDSGASFRALLLGCAYALLFLIVTGLFRSRRRLTLLLAVLLISGTLQAFYGAFMTLSGIEWMLFEPKTWGRGLVTGTFVNRNHMAGYLEMTLAAGIGLLMALRDGRPFDWRALPDLLLGPKAWIRLALVIMVIGLVMTHSRMGNVAFFSSLLVVGGLFALVHPEHRLRNGAILISLLLIDLLIVSQHFGLDNLRDRLAATQLEDLVVDGEVVRHENVDRDDIALYALPQFLERPWSGYGAGAFEASFQRFPGPDVRARFDHAHNDYLQFAIEFGVIGMLPLALFVLMALGYALRALCRRRSLYRNGVGLGAAMGITALMIHATSDFNHQIPANAATFVVLCAIAVLAVESRGRRNRNAALAPPTRKIV
ncbi:O-antigen ligase family protein [Thiohalocapsa marina]|uniref:O-antigen ligase family protein n=1 Tax=Thiohalocapsa marina TaxID=424902 RepID=A0A5M8FAI6_9GAMM|nr:O-antigen ligase family protein [Thiohalocapsa marina]KAA6181858.1 O-antigen ligase family protein [Thiohalocapsa marina]